MLNQQLVLDLKNKLESERNQINEGLKDRLKGLFLDRNELTDIVDQTMEELNFFDKVQFSLRDMYRLRRIKLALSKIDDGTYGECEVCGTSIHSARLRANPVSSKCIYCQEDQENRSKGLAVTIPNQLAAY